MSKVIFVLQRRPGTSREDCHSQWNGERHTSIVGRIPGLTGWVQNAVVSAPGEPVCDGVGELWFENDDAMQQALSSPEMAAAVDDAKTFLDMDRTGLVIVEERSIAAFAQTADGGKPLGVDTSRQLAEAWAAAWSSGDPDRVVALFTGDCVYEDVTLGAVNRGSEQLRAFAAGFMTAIPDFKFEVVSSFATEDRLNVEWRMTGTHANDLPDMPATGRKFDLRGATVVELEAGKGTVCRDYWDMATLRRQLGLAP